MAHRQGMQVTHFILALLILILVNSTLALVKVNMEWVSTKQGTCCNLGGVVVRRQDHAPLQNAVIQISREGGPDQPIAVRSKNAGQFEFDNVPPAQYADAYFALKEGLEALFGRPVDLVTENNLSNPYFRDGVTAERRIIYAR